ncbi:MAG: HAD-IIA family hydrolase [archaeon]|nr:HAD-IIA family hydrolase [archaeon]
MIRGLAIDMDGTIYKGMCPIPGAVDFVRKLNEIGIPFVFVTNNSSKKREYYYEKLVGMGFDVCVENVLTSGIATLEFLKKKRRGKTVYLLGTDSYLEELEEYGIKVGDKDPDIVLLSFDKTITYEKINNAYQFLMSGAEFIATHPDDLCPTENGYDVDVGPFIAMFNYLTQKEPIIIGKPNSILLDMAASVMNVRLNEIAVVGDRLYTDIKMALDNGVPSILVLTGETDKNDLKNSSISPTMTFDSVADIIDSVFSD